MVIALGLLAVVSVWWFLTGPLHVVQPLFLPSPTTVVSTARQMIEKPYLGRTLLGHASASLKIVLGGWLLGGLLGVPLGISMAWWDKARWITMPVFQVLRPVPPLAWIPLAIIWLGIGDTARMFVVFLSAVVPWVINSMAAVESVDRVLINASRTLGASSWVILRRVVVKTALPTILAGARIALGNAWTTVVAAELLGAASGLGYVALNAARALDTSALLVAMFTIGALGASMSFGLRVVARALGPWASEKAR